MRRAPGGLPCSVFERERFAGPWGHILVFGFLTDSARESVLYRTRTPEGRRILVRIALLTPGALS